MYTYIGIQIYVYIYIYIEREMCTYIYIYIYLFIYVVADPMLFGAELKVASRSWRWGALRLSCMLYRVTPRWTMVTLRLFLLRFVDSKLPGDFLWTRELHLLKLTLCLGQTLWNPARAQSRCTRCATSPPSENNSNNNHDSSNRNTQTNDNDKEL